MRENGKVRVLADKTVESYAEAEVRQRRSRYITA